MIKKYQEFILEFNAQQRADNLLDKISKSGLDSLSNPEKDFLDSFSKGDEEKVNKKLNIGEGKESLVSEDGLFKFKLSEIEEYAPDEYSYSDIMIYGELYYNGEEYYGKFNYTKRGDDYKSSYYIFNPMGSPGGVGHGWDEGYFDDDLESNGHEENFYDFIEEVKSAFL